MQHFDSGDTSDAPRSSSVRLPGRCKTHTWSSALVAMPLTWPRIQLLGSARGQLVSTW